MMPLRSRVRRNALGVALALAAGVVLATAVACQRSTPPAVRVGTDVPASPPAAGGEPSVEIVWLDEPSGVIRAPFLGELPPGRLRFEVRLPGPANRASVEEALRRRLPADAAKSATVRWIDDVRLQLELEALAGKGYRQFGLELDGAELADGRRLSDAPKFTFLLGTPLRVAIEPAAGGERRDWLSLRLPMALGPVSPDGRRAIVYRNICMECDGFDPVVYWVDTADGSLHDFGGKPLASIWPLVWAPAGDHLLGVQGGAVRRIHLDGRIEAVGKPLARPVFGHALSPDGTRLAFARWQERDRTQAATLVVQDLASGETRELPGVLRVQREGLAPHPVPLAWSRDGRRLYFASAPPEGDPGTPAFSGPWTAHVVGAAPGAPLGEPRAIGSTKPGDLMPGHTLPLPSPDGRLLAWDRRIVSPSAETVASFPPGLGIPVWSPDSTRVLLSAYPPAPDSAGAAGGSPPERGAILDVRTGHATPAGTLRNYGWTPDGLGIYVDVTPRGPSD